MIFWLNENQLIELPGYKQPARQLQQLRKMGYACDVRADGKVIVPVSNFTELKKTEYKMDLTALG